MGIAPDVLIRDRYRLLERIAVGSTSEVWRATDLVLTRHVAVKILHAERVDDQAFRERFRAEARHAARLSHPGVAEVHDYGEQGDLAFLVMEYLPGQSLEAILDQRGGSAQSQLALSLEATLEIVAQVARALQAAHDLGLIHRDIKPANLIVGPSGDVKITDFGTARALDASTVTEPGVIVGTAQYLSPEQAGGRALTPATDIYTLGVVAYTCLTGEPPFGGPSAIEIAAAHVHDPPASLPKVVPPPVRELVEACLAKDPASRPASAAELAGRCVASRAALPKAAPAPEVKRRRPAPLGAAAAGAAFAVGGMLLLGSGQDFFASTPVSANGQQVDLGGDRAHPQPVPGPVGDQASGSPESAIGSPSGSARTPSGRGGGDMQPYPAAPAQSFSPPTSARAESTGSASTAQPSMTGGTLSPSAAPPSTSGGPTPESTPTPFRAGTPSGTPVPFGSLGGDATTTERGETPRPPSSTSPPPADPAEPSPAESGTSPESGGAPEPSSAAGTPSRSATTSSTEPTTPADSAPPESPSPSEPVTELLPAIGQLLDPQTPAGSGG